MCPNRADIQTDGAICIIPLPPRKDCIIKQSGILSQFSEKLFAFSVLILLVCVGMAGSQTYKNFILPE